MEDVRLSEESRTRHCRGCAWFSICGGPSPDCAFCACEGVRPCRSCGIRCAYREDEPEWLADVGGTLELHDVSWTKLPLPDGLPRYIPVIKPRRGLPPWPAYAVPLDKLLVDGGRRFSQRWLRETPQVNCGLPPSTRMVASLLGPDPEIEGFWQYQFRGGLLDQLAAMGFDLVIAPNYSVYGDQPRYEHLLNLKRSLLIAERMRQRGIFAVPNLYPWRRVDMERLGEWAERVGLDVVGHNCQTYQEPREWEAALVRLTLLRRYMPSNIVWFFSGVSSRERMQVLARLFPRSYFLSAQAYMTAVHGRRITVDGRVIPFAARPEELLPENLRVIAGWIREGKKE